MQKQTTALPPTLSLGKVELNVIDLEKMKEFYYETMGLDILEESTEVIIFGKYSEPLLTLHKTPDLRRAHITHAGLYHFAILFSSRGDLSRTIHRIVKNNPEYFSGSADHLVSEAFYFNDPEGNGIELYYDRDRSLWQYENGHVKMASLYIDPIEYLQRHLVLEEKDTKTSIGHIHLKVGDIAKAREFYVDKLGFDVTAELPQALFISVGGYHHHIGINTWESFGSLERLSTLGLKRFEIILEDANEIELLKKHLKEHNINFVDEKESVVFDDPWKNQISVSSKKS